MPGPPRGNLGSDTVTHGFRVVVTPQYLPEHSVVTEQWQERKYVFAYQIRITNESGVRATLRSRRWRIVNAEGERHEVHGEGVVGHQPDIALGQFFEYASFCQLETPSGAMEGHYVLREVHTGESLAVAIGRFELTAREMTCSLPRKDARASTTERFFGGKEYEVENDVEVEREESEERE